MKEINISFTGEYKYTIDKKGRLNIPAKYRKVLHPSNNNTFIITRGFDSNLIVYPVIEWVKVEEQLSLLSSIKNKDRNFVRSIVRYANYTKYDAQGRIQIPDSLIKFSGITKDVSVIGMIKKIELWDPIILRERESSNSNMADKDFDDLADEINF